MKKIYALVFFVFLVFSGCVTNPLTGKTSMALIGNNRLYQMSFEQYAEFKTENKVVTGTAQTQMVQRVGRRIQSAAIKWYASLGQPNYFKDYKWEFTLIDDKTVNAWAMPGGKIVFYTGILDFMKNNEDEIAVVMGHEVAHAMLNHAQQRMSQAMVQQFGVSVLSAFLGGSDLITSGLSVLTNVFIALPNSRENEFEADEYGLYLMSIAGYNPSVAGPFWDRMSGNGGINLSFLSTHPYGPDRAKRLRDLVPEARKKAREVGVIK
jgi:predicted Zn-dependent protease